MAEKTEAPFPCSSIAAIEAPRSAGQKSRTLSHNMAEIFANGLIITFVISMTNDDTGRQ
jgi:hypothetical protein